MAGRYARSFTVISALLVMSLADLGNVLAADDMEALNSLSSELRSKGARLEHHRKTGKLNFLGTAPGSPIAPPVSVKTLEPKASARAYLRTYGPLFGIKNADTELGFKRERPAANGRVVVRFRQLHQGVPVVGGELIVNMDQQHNLLSMNGEVSPGLSLATTPAITPETAADTAIAAVAKWHNVKSYLLTASPPVLSVYDPRLIGPDTFPPRLVWQLEVTPTKLLPIREYILIDALRGNIALHFNQLDNALDRKTYTANNSTALPGTLVCDETDPACSTGDADAIAAHLYSGDTYNFYKNIHGRDSLDDAGMTLISTVHYRSGYQNAFWNGTQMVYGDGFSLADDVVAHELTHGVTEHESNLFYYYQSGAINESLSDTWGEFIDLSNGSGNDDVSVRWLLGEDIPGVGAIRSMSDPTVYSDPDRIGSPFYFSGTSDNDSGGVHSNSGVNNKAVFLMTDGGTFNGYTIYAMGIPKVAKIYYEVQTNFLTSGSDYLDLHHALYQACLNLVGTNGIGTADCTNVRNTTLAVEMDQMPTDQYNPDATMCPSDQVVITSFTDDIESGTTNWVFDRNSGSYPWIDWYDIYAPVYGPYATSGAHSLFGIDSDSVSDTFAILTLDVPNLARHTPYLYFKHAYDFEVSFGLDWDGGVFEYSTDGGSNWNDGNGLIDSGKNYNGSINNLLSSNPLQGRRAFVATSHGYVSSRVNLNQFRGNTTGFRWRVATDSSLSALGWWLDDVNLYHCNRVPNAIANSYTLNEDNAKAITLTGSDGDKDPLTFSIISGPSYGIASGTPPDITYTPNANYFGNDSLVFQVDDGAGSVNNGTIAFTVIPVNDRPTISTVADQVIDEDNDTGALNFTISDIETSADSLVLSATSSREALVPTANVVFGGTGNNRTVTVTPAPDQNGSTTISLAVSDGVLSKTAAFNLTVNPVNDAPSAVTLVAPINAATGVDAATVNFDWDAATDVDGDRVTYKLYVCEDVGMSVNCVAPVTVAKLDSDVVLAGFGGNGILLLAGLAGFTNRRSRFITMTILAMAMLLVSGCGGGQPPVPTAASVTNLSPGTVYYWKVQSDDGNGGITDSATWSFTTAV